jgi:hypothetical protein
MSYEKTYTGTSTSKQTLWKAIYHLILQCVTSIRSTRDLERFNAEELDFGSFRTLISQCTALRDQNINDFEVEIEGKDIHLQTKQCMYATILLSSITFILFHYNYMPIILTTIHTYLLYS